MRKKKYIYGEREHTHLYIIKTYINTQLIGFWMFWEPLKQILWAWHWTRHILSHSLWLGRVAGEPGADFNFDSKIMLSAACLPREGQQQKAYVTPLESFSLDEGMHANRSKHLDSLSLFILPSVTARKIYIFLLMTARLSESQLFFLSLISLCLHHSNECHYAQEPWTCKMFNMSSQRQFDTKWDII